MTATRLRLPVAAALLVLAAGCGGEPETAAPPTLSARSDELTHVVAFTHACTPVVRSTPPAGRYSVLVSVPGLCERARGYVGGLGGPLEAFDMHWSCIGEIRAGHCVDGAFTRGFSWDIRPTLSP